MYVAMVLHKTKLTLAVTLLISHRRNSNHWLVVLPVTQPQSSQLTSTDTLNTESSSLPARPHHGHHHGHGYEGDKVNHGDHQDDGGDSGHNGDD